MAKLIRVYLDSFAWIGLLNGEQARGFVKDIIAAKDLRGTRRLHDTSGEG